MDTRGNIYELTEDDQRTLAEPTPLDPAAAARFNELIGDTARLDGYLKGRADSDREKRGPGANKDLAA